MPGPIPSKWRSGGGRAASRSPRTAKICEPGGHWTYTMHGPDGTDYPNKTQYFEVEKHAKLVYDHGGNDDRPPLFRVTVLFSETDGKTKMDMTMTLPTPEAAEETRKFIKKAGGNSTWDRLAEYLEKESSGKDQFVINRSFDVPLETMFEMWTNPEALLAVAGADRIRHGVHPVRHPARRQNVLFHDEPQRRQNVWPGRVSENREAQSPGLHAAVLRREQREDLSSSDGADLARDDADDRGIDGGGPDRTRVTVTWEPYGATTREELETFIKARAGMTQGWTGSFDKLEEYLANP